MQFRDLSIGATFDFIDDTHRTRNSFFDRCRKVSKRSYVSTSSGTRYTVGTIAVDVYHVEQSPHVPFYTWRPDRRASRACIRHFISKAVEDKAWAATITDEWKVGASVLSLEMLGERQSRSLHHLARHALEYCRCRAFMPGAYGQARTGDRPAAELWDNLNP